MARALPIREIFVPFLLLTAAVLAGCASSPCRPGRMADPPAAPSELTAVLPPGGPLVLEWRDHSFEETASVVIEDCGESRGRLADTVGRDRTRVAVERFAPGSTCSFAAFAADRAGMSRPGNLATIGTGSTDLPPGSVGRSG